MNTVIILAAIAATLVSLSFAAASDPKRRRVSGLPAPEKRRGLAVSLSGILLPGVLLIALGDGAGFVVWLGASTVAGWIVAALPPDRSVRIRQQLTVTVEHLVSGLGDTASSCMQFGRNAGSLACAILSAPRRIAELEERVRRLEALLAIHREDAVPQGKEPENRSQRVEGSIFEAHGPRRCPVSSASREGI